jgi:secreted Zn-dependent insulinase-like peptidase
MHYYPPANVLNYKEVFEPFNEEHFTRVFKQLTPNRLLVALSSNDEVKDSKVEKYLGAPYRLDPLPKLTKDPLENLVIPKNLFLPVDTTILPEDKDASAIQPKKLSENVVFLPDKVFRSCKGGISLHVYSNEDKINQELYSNWLEAMLKTHTYSAETLKTNLEYEYGTLLCINFYGFSDVLLKLLKEFPDWIAATTTKEL